MEGGKFVSNLIVGAVPYPGNLWKRYASLGAKKKRTQRIMQYSTETFLFYQTDNKRISFV